MADDAIVAEQRSTRRSQRPVWLGEDRRQWDHVRIHLQLLHDERLTFAARRDGHSISRSAILAIYLGIAAHAEIGTGAAYPSQGTLAGYAGCSPKTVGRAIEILTETGYVEVRHEPGRASTYTLLPPPTLDRTTEVAAPTLDRTTEHPGPEDGGTLDRRTDEQEPGDKNQERDGDSVAAVGHLCDLLAVRIRDHRGGSGRPTISAAWRRDMRLLLERGPLGIDDAGPLTPEQVERAINYTFTRLADPGGDGFCWADQIRSPAGLREKYQRLRDARNRASAAHDTAGPNPHLVRY